MSSIFSLEDLMEKAATLLEVYHDKKIEGGRTLDSLRKRADKIISEDDL